MKKTRIYLKGNDTNFTATCPFCQKIFKVDTPVALFVRDKAICNGCGKRQEPELYDAKKIILRRWKKIC